jgi:Uma2 family endonuclease
MEAMQMALSQKDADFQRYCQAHRDLRIERTPAGKILILPHSGWANSARNAEIVAQLYRWSRRDDRGRAFDPSVLYMLPNGAARSAHVSWILRSRIATLTMDQKRGFPPICPDFVVELRSPSDRLRQVQAKMREWIDNGAKLGWLIDPEARTVYIYRPGQTTERLIDPRRVAGEPPVEGFVLEMADIWNPDL